MNSDGSATFNYIPALVEMPAPAGMYILSKTLKRHIILTRSGFEEYFGPGPHYRWMDDGGNAENTLQDRIRQLPPGEDPESVLRLITEVNVWKNRQEVLDYIYENLEKDPEIEGIVGYSEGSSVGAALLFDEREREKKEGRPRRVKCALFFTGWPPLMGDGKPLLADSTDIRVDVPTIHVVGANGETPLICLFVTIPYRYSYPTDAYLLPSPVHFRYPIRLLISELTLTI